MNIFNIHISLSHEEDKAIAFAISELDKWVGLQCSPDKALNKPEWVKSY
jgi:hypothetical protein